MEVVFLADVHGNLPALKKVLSAVGSRKIFCVGDLVGYNPWPNEVIELARENDFACVLGNHDWAAVSGDTSDFNFVAASAVEWTRKNLSAESVSYLSHLPKTLLLAGGSIFLVHGSPKNPLDEYVYPEHPYLESFLDEARADILVLAHTHVPFARRFDDRVVFNPGSVGQPRDGNPKASYVVFDTETKDVKIRRVEYDIDRVRDKILEEGLPKMLAQRLYLGF